MEPEGSLPHSQQPATCPYTEPPHVHDPPSHLLKNHFNFIFTFMPRSSKLPLPPQVFPPKHSMHLSSPIRATYPTHLILLYLITQICGEKYTTWSSSLCSLLYSRYLVPQRPKYPPQHPIIENNLHSSLNGTDQVSYPNKTSKIVVMSQSLYFWIAKTKDSALNDGRYPIFNQLLNSSWMELWFVRAIPKHFKCSPLSKDLCTDFILLLVARYVHILKFLSIYF